MTLIERLRERDYWLARAQLACEAADLLESQAARIAELEAERDLHKRSCEALVEANKDVNSSLAASQAREQVLRDALAEIAKLDFTRAAVNCCATTAVEIAAEALSTPSDDTALREYGAKLLEETAGNATYEDLQSGRSYLRGKAAELRSGK